MKKTTPVLIFFFLLSIDISIAQTTPTRPAVTEEMRVFKPESTTWYPIQPPGPAGSKAAIIDGKNWPEGPSTLLITMVPGSRFPLMWHSNVEKMYVVQGEFFAILEDNKEIKLTPGSHWYVPAGMIHGARCGDKEPCAFIEMRDKVFDQYWVETPAKKN